MCSTTAMMKIFESRGHFFIWTAEDYFKARSEHSVVGRLIGCLPRFPLQNTHLGLPLYLAYHEARFLVEKGFACIVQENEIKDKKSVAKNITDMRHSLYLEQVPLCQKERQCQFELNMKKIIEGKSKKIKKQKRNVPEDQTSQKECSSVESKEEYLEEKRNVSSLLPDAASRIQIHTARYPGSFEESELNKKIIWCYSRKKEDDIKYFVYKYFVESNYIVSNGSKFGGHFLVYPGDPSRYHSLYIVSCHDHDEKIDAVELIRMSRMGANVKKTFVIASVDFKNNCKVSCVSLQQLES